MLNLPIKSYQKKMSATGNWLNRDWKSLNTVYK